MLRLILVDDEKIIRETIRNIIDWQSLGIEVIGVCKNGIEAYNMILDEYPDIVMTDIKMPGLSGLELINKLAATDHTIEFIILSGYGEFAYAKEAMKSGVKHYLLKPCNEDQIIEVMKSVSDDCYNKRAYLDLKEEQQVLTNNLKKNIIRNIIVEGLSNEADFPLLIKQYGKYFNFYNTNYELCYLYFLDESNLNACLSLLYEYNLKHSPGIPLHAIYVKNTLLVFFQSYTSSYEAFDNFVEGFEFEHQDVGIQLEHVSYVNLMELLESTIEKLKRYEKIYVMNGFHCIPTCNYDVLFKNVELLSSQIINACTPIKESLIDNMKELFNSVEDTDFMKALITNLLLKLPSQSTFSINPMDMTEFLLEISESQSTQDIRTVLFMKFDDLYQNQTKESRVYKDFIERAMSYVDEHLPDPNLSLKWIVENILFMNVDYVSKQFVKQTGDKFSIYLTNARIKRAKELLLVRGFDKIYTIAEEVGCGNNPQYFSQIFKKNTGMTPTDYVKKMNGEIENG